jgi:hypothetical protein
MLCVSVVCEACGFRLNTCRISATIAILPSELSELTEEAKALLQASGYPSNRELLLSHQRLDFASLAWRTEP